MPSRKIYLNLMFIESQSDSDDSESLTDLMTTFKEQMKEIEEASKTIRTQVKDLYMRAKEETTDWLNEPLIPKPALKKWLQTCSYQKRETSTFQSRWINPLLVI